MKLKVILLMLASVLWPMRANHLIGRTRAIDTLATATPQYIESNALARSLVQLERRRYRPYYQGILAETLDGSKVLAELNSEASFNPASVMKMATSFMALSRLGPEYQFRTAVYADSELDAAKKTLRGNLYILSDGDPWFRMVDALALSRSLVRRGLRRVEGDLVIAGPFYFFERFSGRRPGDQLRRAFLRSGIAIKGKLLVQPADSVDVSAKVLYLSRTSEKLKDILWLQNAHSVNEIADSLGDRLGGPAAVEQFLIETAHLESDAIHVERASGLEHNRMTPRAGVQILRELYFWLEEHQMKMQDIMPVAGIDEGTLCGRFRDPDFRGGVLGKTGTNPSKDGGISALAGLVHTRDHGLVLYAIFNSHGSITTYRRWQDKFLKDLIAESGGLGEYLTAHAENVGIYPSSSWMPSEYWGSLSQDITRPAVVKKAKYQPKRVARIRRSSSRRTGA